MNEKTNKAHSLANKMIRNGHTSSEIVKALNNEDGFDDHHFIATDKAIFMIHDDTQQRQYVCSVFKK